MSVLPLDLFKKINQDTSVPDKCPCSSPIDLNIRCGPILKLFNCDQSFIGSLLVVIEDYQELPKVSYKLGPGSDSESGIFKGKLFYEEKNYQFFRFDINIKLTDDEQVVHYYINDQTTEYWQFYIPSLNQSMNVMSYSCNGFSLACDASTYPSSLWYDVLKNHTKTHYHVMLGGGDQLYCDSIKLASKELQNWLGLTNGHKKTHVEVSDNFSQEVKDYYLNQYMGWFGKGYWKGKASSCLEGLFPVAQATIPSVNIFDDHDIIDGFGSYPEATMSSPIFKTLGKLAFKYYMIFQHHQLPDEPITYEKSWIKGQDNKNYMDSVPRSIYSKLGKGIGLVGIDCRTERTLHTIVKPKSYQAIFSRMTQEMKNSPDIKHFLVMLGVPILYPRLVWLEMVLNSPLLYPLKKLASKGIIAKGLVNEFDGGIEVLDDLNDHWCSKHHKAERNRLMKELGDFGAANSVRITILSGDVHLGCIGRLKSKFYHHPTFHQLHQKETQTNNLNVVEYPHYDPRLIFNVISSAIINAPPPDAMANLLDKRSKGHRFNRYCDEDMVPLFNVNPDGTPRSNVQFLNKRNWCDLIIASQSVHSNDISDDLDQPGRVLPGSVKKKHEYSGKETERYVKYPLLKDSLVTTLHFEDDPQDFEVNSMGYEVLIPPLVGHYQLEDEGIKHL